MRPLYIDDRDWIRQNELDEKGWKPLVYGSRLGDDSRILHSPMFRGLANKTQLFPHSESSLVRNRLTHTLEVADIARRIANRLNREEWSPFFVEETQNYKDRPRYRVNKTVLNAACLAHDIGHPPFGHSGEFILRKKVNEYREDRASGNKDRLIENLNAARKVGAKDKEISFSLELEKIEQKLSEGFEGNAQSLRVVTRLEKRRGRKYSETDPTKTGWYARRDGLNLTVRTLASIIKYDRVLGGPDSDGVRARKGYYLDEAKLVSGIRDLYSESYGKEIPEGSLRTLECSIMDLADDIAYSTYDFEDAMIMGIVEPSMLYALDDPSLQAEIAKSVEKQLRNSGYPAATFSTGDLKELAPVVFSEFTTRILHGYDFSRPRDRAEFFSRSQLESRKVSSSRELRRMYTEAMIERMIEGVQLDYNGDHPEFSSVSLREEELVEMLIRKSTTFEIVTMSHPLRVFDRKSENIVGDLFDELMGQDKRMGLIPFKHRREFEAATEKDERERFVADFIASMNEPEAIELHSAIKTGDPIKIRSLNYFG